MGESDISHTPNLYFIKGIRIADTTEKILLISYPNSNVTIRPNSNSGDLFLSEANDRTYIFIESSLGLDTVVIEIKKSYEYQPSSKCNDAMIKKNNADSKITYHTFDSCYLYSQFNRSTSNFTAYKYDSLIIVK